MFSFRYRLIWITPLYHFPPRVYNSEQVYWNSDESFFNAILHFLRQSRGTLPTIIAHSMFPYLFLWIMNTDYYVSFFFFKFPSLLISTGSGHCLSIISSQDTVEQTTEFSFSKCISNVSFACDLAKVGVLHCCIFVWSKVDVADSLAPSYWQCKRARDWNTDTLCPSVVIKRKAGNNRSVFASPWH